MCLSASAIFSHIISQLTIISVKKIIEYKLFWFSLQLLSETILIPRIIQRDIIIHVQYSTVQYSTVEYSTVQYSAVQYSAVQYSTV